MKNTFKGKLSFEYNLNHKNWGFIDDDEPFEQFYEGNITALFSPDYPKTIGVFELVVYELDKAKRFNQFNTLIETISDLSNDYTSRFTNINKVINDHYLDFKGSEKVIYLKNVIIHPDYRGSNVLDELIKSIYITHYNKNSLYLVNSFPIQVVKEELEYYFDDFYMDIIDGHSGHTTNVKVGDYFKLKDLPQDYDEMIDYKLFARMQKLNFKKFDNTHYFYLEKEEDIMKLFKDDYEKVSNT